MVVSRSRTDFVHLSEVWEAEAERWIQWVRTPGHDSYWQFHRDQFLRLLPPPGRQTVDIGARATPRAGFEGPWSSRSCYRQFPFARRRGSRVRSIDGHSLADAAALPLE